MCYLLNKEYVKPDEDSMYVLLVFKVPVNFLNNSKFFDSKGQSKVIIKNVGHHQAVRLNSEIPISTEMWESMTALQFKFDMTSFNDTVFKFDQGHLRHYAEFVNVRQSIVPIELVKEILQMSTFQVIQVTGGFYFDQLDLVDQLQIYDRCWDFVKYLNKLDQDYEVDRAMPSTLKKFKGIHETLKEPFYKAGINKDSSEEEIAKLNRELKAFLFGENQDEFKKLIDENEALKNRVGDLEEMMVKLSGGKFKLPSTGSSSIAMEVDPQEPSAQGISSPALKRKKSSTFPELYDQADDDH